MTYTFPLLRVCTLMGHYVPKKTKYSATHVHSACTHTTGTFNDIGNIRGLHAVTACARSL